MLKDQEKITLEDLKKFLDTPGIKNHLQQITIAPGVTVIEPEKFVKTHVSTLELFLKRLTKIHEADKQGQQLLVMPTFNRLKAYCLILEKLQNENL
jgi:predicted transcriptional regulator